MSEHTTERADVCTCAPDCAERNTCPKVGQVGHWQCGWCDAHGVARHRCGCLVTAPATTTTASEDR